MRAERVGWSGWVRVFRALIVLWVAAAGLTLSAAVEADKPTVIRFGISSIGSGGVPFVGSHVIGSAHAKGLLEAEFKADGITVDWLFHKGAGPAVTEDIAAGKIDIAWQGDLPSLIARAAGLHTRLLMAANRGGNTYLAVPAGSPARSLRDLVGKRMVMFKGTATQLIVDRILRQQGFTERDFRIVTLDAAASLTALSDGDVDAAWGTLAWFDLRDRGLVRFVFSTQEPPPNAAEPWASSQSALIVTDDFASRYPHIVQRIVNVLVKEAVWAADPANSEQLYALWAKSGTPAAHYREEYGVVPPARRLSPLLDAEFMGNFRIGMQQAVTSRLIRGPVDLDAWVDRSFLDHALAALPHPLPWAGAGTGH